MIKYIIGDCRKVLRTLPDQSVHCIVTSPPYWGLRDYGLPPLVWGGDEDCQHMWGAEIPGDARGGSGPSAKECYGGNDGKTVYARQVTRGNWCQRCGAWRGSLGLEPTPSLYVSHLVGIFREARRVLRDDGTLWLNMGDTYSRNPQKGDNSGWGKHAEWITDELPLHARPCPETLPEKNLIGIPWRVAFALQADGWWLRSDIIWHKPNCMPASIKDRPTCAHEYLFLLVKSQSYFYDADAIREKTIERSVKMPDNWATHSGGHGSFHRDGREKGKPNNATVSSRNKRTVWTIATSPFPEAHFATFPPALVEPCIKAGTSERGVCPWCGAPWERVTEQVLSDSPPSYKGSSFTLGKTGIHQEGWASNGQRASVTTTTGWRPTCSCYDGPYHRDFQRARSARKRHQQNAQHSWFLRARQRPGLDSWKTAPAVVLDPFGGAGTTGLVADQLGRDCTLIDLKDEYAEMTEKRILGNLGPMFTEVELVAI